MSSKASLRTSLAVQWLRLHVSTAGCTGLIPGRGTKIPHAEWHRLKKKKKEKKSISDSGKGLIAGRVTDISCRAITQKEAILVLQKVEIVFWFNVGVFFCFFFKKTHSQNTEQSDKSSGWGEGESSHRKSSPSKTAVEGMKVEL